jgi:hypothetical protein
MKKQFYAFGFLILSGIAFVGCQKESIKPNSQVNDLHGVVKSNTVTDRISQFDSIGIIHNTALDYIYNALNSSATSRHSKQEVKAIALQANLNFLNSLNVGSNLNSKCTGFLNGIYNGSLTYKTFNDIQGLSLAQKSYFDKLNTIFDSQDEDVNSLVASIKELEILAVNELNNDEEPAFLAATSVAKSTLGYFKRNQTKWQELFVNYQKAATWKGVGKADAAGAAGAVSSWGVYAMFGGPTGWTAVGSAAAAGAAGASVYEAIVSWW